MPRPYILVADDEAENRRLLQFKLELEGYRVETVSSGPEAVELVCKEKPDLILMDIVMPGGDGLEACRVLREDGETAQIPVIFLTGQSDFETKLTGLSLGVRDYLTKPVDLRELVVRVRNALNLKREFDRLRRQAETLQHQNQQLQTVAVLDDLTGLLNRRGLIQRSMQELAHARRHDRPLTIGLLDIDYFKQINDAYGHPAGDQVLRELARRLSAEMRSSDVLGRWGGEEFMVLLPDTPAELAQSVCERLRLHIESAPVSLPDRLLHITVSLGYAVFPTSGTTFDALLHAADTALYEAKRGGRNRISGG